MVGSKSTECAESLVGILGVSTKRRHCRSVLYKMELIYIQTRLKCLSSTELYSPRKKIDNNLPLFDLNIWTVSRDVLGLIG